MELHSGMWRGVDCGGVSQQEKDNILKTCLRLDLRQPVEAWKSRSTGRTTVQCRETSGEMKDSVIE